MSAGAKLRPSDSADIELLTAIFHDLKGVKGPASSGLFVVQHVLSEVLSPPLTWSPGARQESDPDPESQPFQDSGPDSDDETWVEEWDPESLYRWILDVIRGVQTQNLSPECRDISKRLGARLAVSDSARSPDAGILPDVSGNGSPSCKQAEEDLAVPSPISFLPIELLRHIFHFAHSYRSEIRIPVTLSHVNSSFRSVALGMASLWTTIDDLVPIPMVELYIARSGEKPLQFRMYADWLASLPQGDGSMDILLKESKRIKAIEVYGFVSTAFTRWARLAERDSIFSSLEKLELVISRLDSGPTWGSDAVCPVWESFPSLQDLWIQGYPCENWTSPSDPFPPGLRRLKLSRTGLIGLEYLLQALQGCVNLNVLSLDYCSVDFSMVLGIGRRGGITMACLEKLEVARMHVLDITWLSGYIKTPNLAYLSITYPVSLGFDLADFLIPFPKTHPRLCSLVLQECSMTSKAWSSTLENSVHLKHLVIRGSDVCDDDLRALTVATTVPNITHLTLDNELRLTTSFVQEVVRTHPHLVSVILRGWDSFNSRENAEVIARLVPYVQIHTIGKPQDDCEGDSGSEEDSWDDSYWEGSDFSEDDGWLSGDEAIRSAG